MTNFQRAIILVPIASVFMTATPGGASSDTAWAEFNQRVTRSCVAAMWHQKCETVGDCRV